MTELTPQKSFQQKLEERIRKDIGELMPDEALAEIVNKAVEKAFFEDRVSTGRYGETNRKPPWMVDAITELMEQQVRQAVEKWVADNNERLIQVVRERLDKGIVSAVINALDSIFSGFSFDMQNRFEQVVNQIKQGI